MATNPEGQTCSNCKYCREVERVHFANPFGSSSMSMVQMITSSGVHFPMAADRCVRTPGSTFVQPNAWCAEWRPDTALSFEETAIILAKAVLNGNSERAAMSALADHIGESLHEAIEVPTGNVTTPDEPQ